MSPEGSSSPPQEPALKKPRLETPQNDSGIPPDLKVKSRVNSEEDSEGNSLLKATELGGKVKSREGDEEDENEEEEEEEEEDDEEDEEDDEGDEEKTKAASGTSEPTPANLSPAVLTTPAHMEKLTNQQPSPLLNPQDSDGGSDDLSEEDDDDLDEAHGSRFHDGARLRTTDQGAAAGAEFEGGVGGVAGGGGGGGGGGLGGEETEETKASHKMAERRRRQRMSGLFETLKALLPPTGHQGKTSKGWVLLKAIDLIHHLEYSETELVMTRDNLLQERAALLEKRGLQ